MSDGVLEHRVGLLGRLMGGGHGKVASTLGVAQLSQADGTESQNPSRLKKAPPWKGSLGGGKIGYSEKHITQVGYGGRD